MAADHGVTMEQHEVDLARLQMLIAVAAQRAQDQSIGDRDNYIAHAMHFVKLVGVLEFVTKLRADGAKLIVSRSLAHEFGLIQEVQNEDRK